jgi:hypothetical protein
MRVLFAPAINHRSGEAHAADYMVDCVFHGLRSIMGADVVDYPKAARMYRTYDDVKGLWGKGFSLYGLLDDIEVDRSDIEDKTKKDFFDLVITGVHVSCNSPHHPHHVLKHVGQLAEHLPANRLAFLDGLDQSGRFYGDIERKVTYFKRELEDESGWAHPISFAIPAEKVTKNVFTTKDKDFATCIPWHENTYGFVKEHAYYHDYASSLYGYTCKKGGWDCMRHYEILAQGCVPYFPDLEKCPRSCLVNLPRASILEAMRIPGVVTGGNLKDSSFQKGHVDRQLFDRKKYDWLANSLLEYTRRFLTTESLAKYVLGHMR